MRALATEAGLNLEIEYVPWNRAQVTVAEHSGLLLFAITRNSRREDKYDWVTNLVTAERVFVTTGTPVNSLDEARELDRIDATGVYYRSLETEGFTNLDDGNHIGAFKKLEYGRVDAVFTIAPRAIFNWTNELGLPAGDLVIGNAIAAGDLWLAASKGYNRDIMRRLDAANQTLRANGMHEIIYRKYFGELPILPAANPEKRPTAELLCGEGAAALC